jgi:predicted dehydrogenase
MVDMNSEPKLHNRREFLSAAMGAAVTVGLGATARGADTPPVRVAVVGAGGRGSDLIRKLTTIAEARLVAVCDDYPPHLSRAAEYAGPQATLYSRYDEMLAKAKPQAVIVAVPLWLHFKMCQEAIEAGCDVFCEKTLCYSIEEARALAKRVAESKCVFQVGLQRRSNPIYQQAKAMISAGMIGRITAIKAQWNRNNNWRRPIPVARTDAKWAELEQRLNWRLYRRYSRGLMAELGSHQMDVANWMLDAVPRRVMGTGSIDYWRDGREVPDNVFCTYEYRITPPASDQETIDHEPYTVRATYSALCNNAYEGATELILGTRGTLYLTDLKGLLYSERRTDEIGWVKEDTAGTNASIVTSGKTLGLANDPWAHRGKPVEIDRDQGDDTRDELVSFIDHVSTRDTQTICDVRAGLRNAATILMAQEAIEAGKTVEFPAI